MRKTRFVLPVLACWLVLLLPSKLLFADRTVPPTAKALFGAWVGYEDGSLYFYRLVLGTNGTGSCVVLFNDETADSYRVDDWRMANGKLSLKLSPKSKNAEDIAMVVTYVDALKIGLVVKGVTNTWERKVSLYNEREFLNRANKTAKRNIASPSKR
jgi:hypothetical protein